MVTGASTADAVVVLVDAARVAVRDANAIELLPQTRRHTALAQLLGIRHIAVAVNKMDAIGYSRDAYQRIVAAYRALAERLGVDTFTPLPVSALHGDNVVDRSAEMPWYEGPTLIEWLEDVPSSLGDSAAADAPFRLAVQVVLRSTADRHGGARRYAGRVAAGRVAVGDRVRIAPGGAEARVARIETFDGALDSAGPGRSISVQLDRELDLSRGDWLVAASAPPREATSIEADVAWLDVDGFDPAAPPRRLWLQHGTRSVHARVRRHHRALRPAGVAVAGRSASRAARQRHRARAGEDAVGPGLRSLRAPRCDGRVRARRSGHASHRRCRDDPPR